MKHRTYTLFLVALAMTITSCSDLSQERSQVASLITQADEAGSRLKALHPDSLPMTNADITGRLDKVTQHYAEQKLLMDRGTSQLMADFKVFTKVFKGLTQKRARMEEEIALSKSQLLDLDRDLKERALEPEKAKAYVAEEKKAMDAITASLDALDTLMSRGSRGYLRVLPRMDSLIQDLPMPALQ